MKVQKTLVEVSLGPLHSPSPLVCASCWRLRWARLSSVRAEAVSGALVSALSIPMSSCRLLDRLYSLRSSCVARSASPGLDLLVLLEACTAGHQSW